MSSSLWPHRLQHARFPCPLPCPRVCSNSYPLSQWCHLTLSSSAVPFSSCSQSLPASGYFPFSQLFASGGQSIGASASMSVYVCVCLCVCVSLKLSPKLIYKICIVVLSNIRSFSESIAISSSNSQVIYFLNILSLVETSVVSALYILI